MALVEARLAAAKGAAAGWERTGLATLLVDIRLTEGRLAAAWAVAHARGLPDHALRRLAEASEAAMPEQALAAYAGLVERFVALTNRQAYEEACRLVARMGVLRAERGKEAQHRTFAEDLLRRHGAKRSFVAMLRRAMEVPAQAEIGAGGRSSQASRPTRKATSQVEQ